MKKDYHKTDSLVRGYTTIVTLILIVGIFFLYSPLYAKEQEDLTSEYFYIAESYAELKKYDKAVEFYKKAIKNTEYANAARYNLGRMYALLNRWDDAVVELKSLYEIEPENQKIIIAYAYALSANGKIEEAKLLYKDIYEVNRESPNHAFNYVRILIVSKEYDEASKLLDVLKEQFIEDEERKIIKKFKDSIEKLLDPLKEERKKEAEQAEKEELKDDKKPGEEKSGENKDESNKKEESIEDKKKEEKEMKVKDGAAAVN